MPIYRVPPDKSGKPGYRWGQTGKVYRYVANNEAARQRARARAVLQARAAYSKGYKKEPNGR